jgi:hypothetical protein
MHPGANPTNIFKNKLNHSICKIDHFSSFWKIVDDSKLVKHGQTLAYRTSLGPSFQLQKWLHASYFALTAWAQCYKTFYGRNLRIFVLSYSVCKNSFENLVRDTHSNFLRLRT